MNSCRLNLRALLNFKVLFGAIAKATDWESTGYGKVPGANGAKDTGLVLPLCLQYLTPPWVAFFGLGAISAAVMSSTDSSMLSASTMIARNVYKTVFRPNATEKEVLIALWVFIVMNCTCATALAIHYKSIYSLFVLCGDFVFVIVFPQLLLVLYFERSNTYGSVFSFFIALLLRLLCGEASFELEPTISFGTIASQYHFNDDGTPMTGDVPYRTFVMLISLACHVAVSSLTHYIFVEEKVPLKYDFLKCFEENSNTGLIHSASSRYLADSPSNGISLDDIVSNGSTGKKL